MAGLGNERSFNKSVDPYRRVDGQLVANDFTDLLNNQLKAPINVTAQGVTVATELVTVWTDVKADGSPFGPTCDGWANIEADGRVGNGNAIGNEWTGDVDSIPCEAGVLEILCQFFKLKHNVMRRIDYDRQIRFQ